MSEPFIHHAEASEFIARAESDKLKMLLSLAASNFISGHLFAAIDARKRGVPPSPPADMLVFVKTAHFIFTNPVFAKIQRGEITHEDQIPWQ
jgi:hypothetical protein